MSIESVAEINEDRWSKIDPVQRSHGRTFDVIATAGTTLDTYDACVATDGVTEVPQFGDAHPTDTAAYVREVSASIITRDSRRCARVTVTYSSGVANWQNINISVDNEFCNEVMEYDIYGVPPENSAHQRLVDPPITVERARAILTCTRYEVRPLCPINTVAIDSNDLPAYPGIEKPRPDTMMGIIDKYNDTINKFPFLGFQPTTLKLNMTATRTVVARVLAWEVVYVLRYKPEGWFADRDDEGVCKLETIGGVETRVLITDPNDLAIPVPTHLNGSGAIRADAADPVIHRWEVYRKEDFNELGLPLV